MHCGCLAYKYIKMIKSSLLKNENRVTTLQLLYWKHVFKILSSGDWEQGHSVISLCVENCLDCLIF